MTDDAGDKGISLIELVVAMAIFALVAVMGLQGLSGMLHIRDRLTEMDDTTSELSRTVALLRNDLNAIVPMRFFPPGEGPDNALAQSDDGRIFALSLAGQPELSPATGSGGLHRAEWRLDQTDKTLTRRVWTTLTPVDPQVLQPALTLMSGVEEMRIRSYWSGMGWIDGPTNPVLRNLVTAEVSDEDRTGPAPENYSDFLPLAIEVTLNTAQWGDITLVETLR